MKLLEYWKTVLYYNINGELEIFNDYEISYSGVVRRKSDKYKISVYLGSSCKYPTVSLSRRSKTNNSTAHIPLHILMASTFLGVREKGKLVDHINRNKLDYRISNLRYVTKSENGINKDKIINTDIFTQTLEDGSVNIYKQDIIDKDKWRWCGVSAAHQRFGSWIKYQSDAYYWIIENNIDLLNLQWKYVTSSSQCEYFISDIGLMKIIKGSGSYNYYTLGSLTPEGYRTFSIGRNNTTFPDKHIIQAHRLVAQMFLNNGNSIESDLIIDHIDTNRQNNIVTNLRICTKSENLQNETTRYNNDVPVKCRKYGETEWLYFINQTSAGIYLNVRMCVITYWRDKKRIRNHTRAFNYEVASWSEEDHNNYKLGKLNIIKG